MNGKHYRWILYLISATIITTIVVQFYWNYKNYEQNKQQVLNEIQLNLNDAVEIYFSDLSKSNFLTILKPKKKTSKEKRFSITSIEIDDKNLKDATEVITFSSKTEKEINHKNEPKIFTQLSKDRKSGIHFENGKIEKIKVFQGKKASDSLKLIKGLRTIFISLKADTLASKKFDSILHHQLQQKNININYAFQFFKHDTLKKRHTTDSNFKITDTLLAKSTFLGTDKKLELHFSNPTSEALKRSSTGILLSLLLSLAVISSLFYLLKIINQQKQLAEIKNDLISNITHEFKTPITTVSTALEAIESFNIIEDKEKTKNYVSISKNQVEKLHLMVEKLLETATLDSEKLLLKKEEINLTILLDKLVKKQQLFTSEKSIIFKGSSDAIIANIDVFHFENAISNLLDNAIKYGGNLIEISLSSEENNLKIEVSDNGKGIEKAQQDKIFDKFYRIPKGNTHDVKGFGIGLYYTKKIIEKHGGSISLVSKPKNTTFTIELMN